VNKSIRQKIQQLEGLVDTKDVTDWENQFIKNMVEKIKPDSSTTKLSSKEVDKIDQIHSKHFV